MTSINRAGLGALQFIDVDGLRLRFAKSEKMSGDPILLLSPWPESICAFLPTWEEFSGWSPWTFPDLDAPRDDLMSWRPRRWESSSFIS
jgi:hypothetical protein